MHYRIECVSENRDDWRGQMYDMDEQEVAVHLARCCGLEGLRLSQLDGWADLPDAALRARTEVALEAYAVVPAQEAQP